MSNAIAEIEAIPIVYPVQGRFKFFERPNGQPMGRAAVVVKITAEDGTVGWGQGVPSERWSYETPETVYSTICRYLAPEIIGKDVFDEAGIANAMNQAIAPSFSTGQPICKAAVELALFDLTGKLLGQSAAQRWGRTGASHVTLSWTLNPRQLKDTAGLIEEAHGRGYRHFNVKISPDPTFDLELCRLIRQLAPEAVLWADANGGYDTDTALTVAPRLADLGVSFFEQPVAANRLSGFAALKRQGALPIIMDEGIVSATELEEFFALGLMDGVAIKVVRCGGLGEARRHVEFLKDHQMIFLGSGLTDPDLSLAASLALFGVYELPYPAALNGPQFLTTSILRRPFQTTDGTLAVPTGPGLGVEVDEAKILECRLDLGDGVKV